MPRDIYLSPNGLSVRTNKLYIGINEVSRPISKVYIGVDGVSKQVWPKIYKWNRYSVKTTNEYKSSYKSDGSDTRYIANEDGLLTKKFPTEMTFDSSTGKFNISEPKLFEISKDVSYPNIYYTTYCTKTRYGDNLYITGIEDTEEGEYDSIYEVKAVYGRWDDVGTWPKYGIYTSSLVSSTESQGDFITSVTSTSRNAYPNNGKSGNYWYVFQGEA